MSLDAIRAIAALVVGVAGIAGAGACDRTASKGREAPAPSAAQVGPASSSAAPLASTSEATLTFLVDGKLLRTVSRAALERAAPPEEWSAYDPYYNRMKRYRALPLAPVLALGFDEGADALAKRDFILRASDGYTVPMSGAKLLERGGYLAIADLDFPEWEPIGERRATPGPFYLVWREAGQQSLETHPRPWQLAAIEIARFEATFPHTVPVGAPPGSAAQRGYTLFKQHCTLCHAMNREGGRVGPDLNVPQSIVEYRPEDQVRQYIRDPRKFRYGAMPPHPHLNDTDLDALVAYFRHMKDLKHDPDAPRPAEPGGDR